MQLKDWLSRLERLHFKSIDMGLERIQAVAQQLDLLHDTPFIFTVAGTNGKGSTVALIDQFLRLSGYTTGLYTSPHLIHFNERICINGSQCTDDELVAAFEAVDAGRGDVSLTYFEFTTLAAIYLFRQQKLDAWILEIGLGGRLDAVNIWNPHIAIVTSIDIDHQAWLGNDRATIGLEKVGIARKAKPLVMGEPNPPLEAINKVHELGASIYQQGPQFNYSQPHPSVNQSNKGLWSATLTAADHSTITYDSLPMPGIYLQNAATALQALVLSPFAISESVLSDALQNVSVTGRKQIIHHKPDVMLDVGHNPHAAKALASYIEMRLEGPYSKVHCIVGMLSDKDITDTLMALLPVVDQWYPVNLNCERSMPASSIFEMLLEMGACSEPVSTSATYACNRLVNSVSKNDLILVFGSFYTVADVIQYASQLNIEKG